MRNLQKHSTSIAPKARLESSASKKCYTESYRQTGRQIDRYINGQFNYLALDLGWALIFETICDSFKLNQSQASSFAFLRDCVRKKTMSKHCQCEKVYDKVSVLTSSIFLPLSLFCKTFFAAYMCSMLLIHLPSWRYVFHATCMLSMVIEYAFHSSDIF